MWLLIHHLWVGVGEGVGWVLGLGLTLFTGWRFGCLGFELSAEPEVPLGPHRSSGVTQWEQVMKPGAVYSGAADERASGQGLQVVAPWV